jgi:hypothetical protein
VSVSPAGDDTECDRRLTARILDCDKVRSLGTKAAEERLQRFLQFSFGLSVLLCEEADGGDNAIFTGSMDHQIPALWFRIHWFDLD